MSGTTRTERGRLWRPGRVDWVAWLFAWIMFGLAYWLQWELRTLVFWGVISLIGAVFMVGRK